MGRSGKSWPAFFVSISVGNAVVFSFLCGLSQFSCNALRRISLLMLRGVKRPRKHSTNSKESRKQNHDSPTTHAFSRRYDRPLPIGNGCFCRLQTSWWLQSFITARRGPTRRCSTCTCCCHCQTQAELPHRSCRINTHASGELPRHCAWKCADGFQQHQTTGQD